MHLPKRIFILCFLSLLAGLSSTSAQKAPLSADNFVTLNVTAFKKELAEQKGVILDVRTPAEYAKGHLPHAINVNYLDPTFKQVIKNLKPEQPYFIYCAVGGRSAKACAQLKSSGLPKIYNLEGGITAWQQAGEVMVK